MCVKALPRLECMGLEGREVGRSTSSYRNPQLVTANVNALILEVIKIYRGIWLAGVYHCLNLCLLLLPFLMPSYVNVRR